MLFQKIIDYVSYENFYTNYKFRYVVLEYYIIAEVIWVFGVVSHLSRIGFLFFWYAMWIFLGMYHRYRVNLVPAGVISLGKNKLTFCIIFSVILKLGLMMNFGAYKYSTIFQILSEQGVLLIDIGMRSFLFFTYGIIHEYLFRQRLYWLLKDFCSVSNRLLLVLIIVIAELVMYFFDITYAEPYSLVVLSCVFTISRVYTLKHNLIRNVFITTMIQTIMFIFFNVTSNMFKFM